MHSTLTLGFLSSLLLLTTSHPLPQSKRSPSPLAGTCRFDAGNPLLHPRQSSPSGSSALNLGSTRPSSLQVPLDEVWTHTRDTRPADLDFANYGYDQILTGDGKINYCVRWESSQRVTQAQRADVAAAVQRSLQKWVDVLAGYDGWPYESVDVEVVGWAVRDEGLLEGDMGGVDVYTTTDAEGAPECDPRCGRFFHQDGEYGECPGGATRHYGKRG